MTSKGNAFIQQVLSALGGTPLGDNQDIEAILRKGMATTAITEAGQTFLAGGGSLQEWRDTLAVACLNLDASFETHQAVINGDPDAVAALTQAMSEKFNVDLPPGFVQAYALAQGPQGISPTNEAIQTIATRFDIPTITDETSGKVRFNIDEWVESGKAHPLYAWQQPGAGEDTQEKVAAAE